MPSLSIFFISIYNPRGSTVFLTGLLKWNIGCLHSFLTPFLKLSLSNIPSTSPFSYSPVHLFFKVPASPTTGELEPEMDWYSSSASLFCCELQNFSSMSDSSLSKASGFKKSLMVCSSGAQPSWVCSQDIFLFEFDEWGSSLLLGESVHEESNLDLAADSSLSWRVFIISVLRKFITCTAWIKAVKGSAICIKQNKQSFTYTVAKLSWKKENFTIAILTTHANFWLK